ncbi:hypothetical protein MtrunA17_Chr2g0307251 [Medicago truncatula]|uniref:Transmembrane protein n=1 Tax=Medicago truncatula TaxID=3880 RepID=A0A396JCP6_MEDTR|nr:hypothetical protein MtrunA17_Chr2g0307251 [Medicago truncatula]
MESFTFFSPFSGSFCSSPVRFPLAPVRPPLLPFRFVLLFSGPVRSGFDCFGSVLACLCLFVICVVI